MSKLYIQGFITFPEGITPGDLLVISGTVRVASVAAEFIDVSHIGRNEYAPNGELNVDSFASSVKAEHA